MQAFFFPPGQDAGLFYPGLQSRQVELSAFRPLQQAEVELVTYGGVNSFRDPLIVDATEFIGVKSCKAKGKRVTTFGVDKVELLPASDNESEEPASDLPDGEDVGPQGEQASETPGRVVSDDLFASQTDDGFEPDGSESGR